MHADRRQTRAQRRKEREVHALLDLDLDLDSGDGDGKVKVKVFDDWMRANPTHGAVLIDAYIRRKVCSCSSSCSSSAEVVGVGVDPPLPLPLLPEMDKWLRRFGVPRYTVAFLSTLLCERLQRWSATAAATPPRPGDTTASHVHVAWAFLAALLRAVARSPRFDLVVTQVVMPAMRAQLDTWPHEENERSRVPHIFMGRFNAFFWENSFCYALLATATVRQLSRRGVDECSARVCAFFGAMAFPESLFIYYVFSGVAKGFPIPSVAPGVRAHRRWPVHMRIVRDVAPTLLRTLLMRPVARNLNMLMLTNVVSHDSLMLHVAGLALLLGNHDAFDFLWETTGGYGGDHQSQSRDALRDFVREMTGYPHTHHVAELRLLGADPVYAANIAKILVLVNGGRFGSAASLGCDDANAALCPITLCELRGKAPCVVTQCGHMFKEPHFIRWMLSQRTCPACRSIVM